MDAGIFIPLAVFALVVLIVAITSVAKLRDKEMEVHQRLYTEELEHRRKMKELALELQRVKHTAQSLSVSVPQSFVRESKALSD
jgi:hypothetical protein